MPAVHRIYLVPGFFGFANLGEVRYWGPVQAALTDRFSRAGVEARVHVVPTPPTASLRSRAHVLLDRIVTTAGDDDVLHLVGHSSGGLDARLLVTPGAVFPGGESAEPWASRVRTVVTVSTPHRGTPSADLFRSMQGRNLLKLLSIATVFAVRRGSLPLQVTLALVDVLRRVADVTGPREPVMVDHLFDALLAEFSDDRRAQVQAFFDQVGADQTLLDEIGPAAMDRFAAPDRDGVRYGCVVTRARPPSLRGVVAVGADAQAQALHATYASCWAIASGFGLSHAPALTVEQAGALRSAYGTDLESTDNDAMVPTLSQVRGEVIRAVTADHLDVIGHYPDADADPPRYDWVVSGSQFRRPHFEATWTDVASWLLGLV